MADKYLSLQGACVTEKVIEKSRFITQTRPVEDEEEAKAFIAEVSKRYSDATHNCYAYISDALGNNLRFSDDGEPQGTAGMPMLEVLRAQNLKKVACVVTRYFGGIKLGAGGLVRAYSGCVSENLASARKVRYEQCAENEYRVSYTDAEIASRFFARSDCTLLNTSYDDGVTFTVAVKACEEEKFVNSLKDALNGRVLIKKVNAYYFPFEIGG